jgi:hypothetical protein
MVGGVRVRHLSPHSMLSKIAAQIQGHFGSPATANCKQQRLLMRRKGMPPRVGVLNTPTPNLEDHHEGKAIYVNEPGFYNLVLGSKKPECKAFKKRKEAKRNNTNRNETNRKEKKRTRQRTKRQQKKDQT